MLLHRFATVLGELAKKVPRGVVKLGWHVDDEVHEQVTATATVKVLDALVADAVDGSVGAAGLDLDARCPSKRRDLDLSPERRLAERDVRFVVQVVAVALETLVGSHPQVHEEPAVGSPANPGGSAVAQAHGGAVLDPGGDLYGERARLVLSSLASTVGAR